MTTHPLPSEPDPSRSNATALPARAAHLDGSARCHLCDKPIAPTPRSDARYCNASCRSAARHARTALNMTASVRARERQAAEEDRQRRACASLPGDGAPYGPPPEWAWLATHYAGHRRSSEDAT
jgi:hypothetical protein